MKILHYYHKNDEMVAQYVSVLERTMAGYADVKVSQSLRQFQKQIKQQQPDIVHLHGCWHVSYAIAARIANDNGARVVLSPHGQLEPWVMRQHYWSEKLPKLIAFQSHLTKHAYALIVMGRMEHDCLAQLKWNPRCETVLNSLITDSLTDEQMASKVYAVYRKVLDSDQWPLMDDETRMAVRGLIKAGQTGDGRWLDNQEFEACNALTADGWRKVALFASHEGILETVARGADAMGLAMPDFNPATVASYSRQNGDAKPPQPLANTGANETERLHEMIRSSRKLFHRRRLTMSHIVELSAFLRSSHADEGKLAELLKEKHLLPYAKKLMQCLCDLTGLEEGFMPVKAGNVRGADKMESIITKHLKI